MYNDQQYKDGRPYYCSTCRHLEPPSEQVTEAAETNDAVNLTHIPMSEFIEKAVAGTHATPHAASLSLRLTRCVWSGAV